MGSGRRTSSGSATSAALSLGRPGRRASRERTIGLLLVVVSACGFGSGALFAKPIYGAGVDWLTLLAWRFLVAAAASWLWLLAFPSARAALRRLSRRRVAVLLTLGVLYVGNSGTYFAALETVSASLAALIVYVYPALVAVLSLRFGRRLEGRRAWFALAMASLGMALAVGGIAPGAVPPLSGLLLAVASPIIYAVWIVLAARLGGERPDERPQPGVPPQDAETTTEPETTEPAPAAALTGRPILPGDLPTAAWLPLLGVGLVSTALAVQTFYAGARRIGAANASLMSTVEPLYTITLATLLFGEVLTPVQLLGGVLVIGGVVLAQTGGGARDA